MIPAGNSGGITLSTEEEWLTGTKEPESNSDRNCHEDRGLARKYAGTREDTIKQRWLNRRGTTPNAGNQSMCPG